MDDFTTGLLPLDRHDMIEGPLMVRYLQENSRPLIETYTYGCPPDNTFGGTYQAQHSLAWSTPSHASAGSVTLSPPADSDTVHEGTYGPATPEFSAPSPPYEPKAMSAPHWDRQHLQHALFNSGYIQPRSRFINPLDINSDHGVTPPTDLDDDLRDTDFQASGFRGAVDSVIDPNLLPSGMSQEALVVGKGVTQQTEGRPTPEFPPGLKAAAAPSKTNKTRRPRQPKRTAPIQPRAPERAARGPVASQVKTERLLAQTQDLGRCNFCNGTFRDTAAVQRHIRSSHRRPLTCVFHYAGCQSTFSAKNEWKRHVLSQHLGLFYWHCTLDHCSQANPLHAHGRSIAPGIPAYGSIFNRKDLYTQHVRRMHLGAESHDKKAFKEAEARLKVLQEAAKKKRCELPLFMECPAVKCSQVFRGPTAWDDRMEHVACHLSRAASGKEEDVLFGGEHDLTLTDWAVSPEVGVALPLPGGGWQHRNPLKGSSAGGAGSSWNVSPIVGDQDAEGEDCTSDD
ncbi:hypothetical protein NLU13_4552 [Sarocladium strictum]|uniref:C2H2-type domain-containing protein n=1 Tax=Sarocladium strictum TaxID=5046 RepID=A0AA39L8S2_SARSR|nr:hypothetical protein NLU13_4552 [Sarocladium strictum]